MTAPKLKIAAPHAPEDLTSHKNYMVQREPPSAPVQSGLSKLLALEGEALAAEDRLALKHIAVNRTRNLLPYGHAMWISFRHDKVELSAISSQAIVDKTTPFVMWMNTQLGEQRKQNALTAPKHFSFTDPSFDYPFTHAFFAPFSPNPEAGGLLFTRDTTFEEKEALILTRLGHMFGTCWAALSKRRKTQLSPKRRTLFYSGLGVLTLCACIPVSMSELAPAEIVADDPFIVTAPIDGVIDTLLVPPNTYVETGTVLARMNDVSYRNELELASEDKSLAEARLRQAALTAFIDDTAKRDIAVAQAEIALAEARQVYARDRLAKTEFIASKAGLAIYSDPQDWTGRPVTTGEAVFQIANPNRILLRIQAPLVSGQALTDGARIRLFADSDPLNPLEATLERAAYYAAEQPGGKMAYTAYARLDDMDTLPRIGTHGVAKIYGPKAPLGFWLLRRPLTALRQFTGL